jgi:hypothetical protein
MLHMHMRRTFFNCIARAQDILESFAAFVASSCFETYCMDAKERLQLPYSLVAVRIWSS